MEPDTKEPDWKRKLQEAKASSAGDNMPDWKRKLMSVQDAQQAPPTDPFVSTPSAPLSGAGGAASAGIPRPAPTASPSMQAGGAPASASGRRIEPFRGEMAATERKPELVATQAIEARLKRPAPSGPKPLAPSERQQMERMLQSYSQDFSPGIVEEKRRIREALALDDDIKARPERYDRNHPDYARVHGRDAYYDAFFSDMDEAGVQKNKARLEQEVAALRKEGDALINESVILGQIESDIQRTPEGPQRDAFINEYNALFSKADSRQRAMEDISRSIDRDNEFLTRRNLEIQRGKGSWGGALWNSTVEGIGKMNRAVFGDLLPDIYVELQDDERIKALGGKDKFKRDMKAILGEEIMGEDGFGGSKAKGTTQEYIDRIKEEHPILGGGILGLAESVPAMATPMMSGIFLQVADGLNEEMKGDKWNDVNEWEKKGMSYLGGAVGMALERFGFKNLVNNSAATKQIIARVIEKLPTNATPGQIQRVLDAETASWAKNYAIRTVGGFAAEAETGAAQEIMDVAMKEAYNLAKSKQLFDTPESVSEFAKDVLVAGVQEGVGGKIMAVPSALSSAMSTKGRIKAMEDRQYEFLEGLLRDPDFQATWDAKAQEDVRKGRMPQAQYEKTLDDWAVAQSVAEQIPDNLPADKRREAFDILLEKQKLKGKDKTLVAGRVAALDEKLAALAGTPTEDQPPVTNNGEAPKTNALTDAIADKKDADSVSIAIIDIASSIEDGKKYGVLQNDGSVIDEEQTLDVVDADYGRIRALSERGRLTKEALLKTSWGRAISTNELQNIADSLNNNPDLVDAVFDGVSRRVSAKEPTTPRTPPIEPSLPADVTGTPLEGIVGGRAVFTRGDERIEGDVYLDGRTVVIETPDRVYEVGNVDDLSSMTAEDMPLSAVPASITVTEDGDFVYKGADPGIAKGIIVPQGSGLKAIKRDKQGNIKRIVVTDSAGNTKNIVGQEAEDLAYRMMLRAVENNQSTLTKNDSITQEIDAEYARQTQGASPAKTVAPAQEAPVSRDGGRAPRPVTPPLAEEAITPQTDAVQERQAEGLPLREEAGGGQEVRAAQQGPAAAPAEEGQVAPPPAAAQPEGPVRPEGKPKKPKKKEDERAVDAGAKRPAAPRAAAAPPAEQAPPGVPLEDAGEVAKSKEAVSEEGVSKEVKSVTEGMGIDWNDSANLTDALDDLKHDWGKDIASVEAGKEPVLSVADVTEAKKAIADIEARIKELAPAAPLKAPKKKAPKKDVAAATDERQPAKKQEEPPKTQAGWKREGQKSVEKPTAISDPNHKGRVEYSIPGFEDIPIVAVKAEGGWRAAIRVGDTDMLLGERKNAEGMPSFAAAFAWRVLEKHGREKVEAVVGQAMAAQSVKEEGPKEQRPSERPAQSGKPNTDKAIKALQDFGVKVIAPRTKQEYQKAIEQFPDGVKSSWGLYDHATRTIYINPEGPDLRNTLFHEGAHPVLSALFRNNPTLRDKFFAEIGDEKMPGSDMTYRQYGDKYADKSIAERMEEAIAQFTADVSDGKVPVSTKPDSLWQRFKDFIKDILAALGWDTRSIDLSKPDNVREFAAQFKKAMDKGIRITGLEPVSGEGVSMQRPKTTKAKEWNAAVDDAVANNLSKGPEQAILDAADLITDPDGKQAFIDAMNAAWGVTTPPLGTKANQKKVSKVLLREELNKAVEAGKRAGIADVAKARKAFVEQIKEALSKDNLKGALTEAQARSITARAASVNPLNPKAVDRFIAYAEKVVEKANYAADIEAAENARARARKLSKGERVPANLKEVLDRFASVDVDSLSDPAKYAEMAQDFMAAFAPKGSAAYKMADAEAAMRYLDSIEAEWLKSYEKTLIDEYGIDDLDGVNAKDLLDAIESGTIDEFIENLENAKAAALKERMVRVAEYARMGMGDIDTSWMRPENRRIHKMMMDVDLSMMSPQQLADFTFVADNIAINQSFDGSGRVASAVEAAIIAKDTAAVTSKYGIRTDWPVFGFSIGGKTFDAYRIWRQMMQATPNAMVRLMGFTKAMGDLSAALGIADIIKAKSSVDQEVRRIGDALDRFIQHQAQKAKRNGRSIESPEARFMEGIVGVAIQRRPGLTDMESLEQQKSLIQQDIEANAIDNPKEYAIIQRIYNQYIRDAKSQGEIKAAFKKAYPENAAILDYLIKMNARYANELMQFKRSFRNDGDTRLADYMPIRMVPGENASKDQVADIGPDFDGSRGFTHLDKSLPKPIQSANLKRRLSKGVLRAGSKVDYNARRNAMAALSRNLFDARTSPRWAAVRDFLKRPDAADILGGKRNVAYLNEMLGDMYESQVGLGLLDKTMLGDIADSIATAGKQLASRIGLAGLAQIVQQPADQITNAYMMTSGAGKRIDFAKTMRDVVQAKDNGLIELLNMGSIGERGELLAGLRWSSALDTEMGKLGELLDGGFKQAAKRYLSSMNKKWFGPMRVGDVFSSTTAWVSFYKKYMAERGHELGSWRSEAAKLEGGDMARKGAFAYAEMMTAMTQGPSDPSMFSPWARRGRYGVLNLLKAVNNPFGSFPASMRARLAQAKSEMLRYSRTPTSDPSKQQEVERFEEAKAVMTATAASAAAFEAARLVVVRPLIGLLAGGVGYAIRGIASAIGDDDEEDEYIAETALAASSALIDMLQYGAVIDRETQRIFEEADREFRDRRRMGMAFDQEEYDRKRAGQAMKMSIANYLSSMSVGGVAKVADSLFIDGINWMYYCSEVLEESPNVVKPSGKVIPFDQWLKDTEKTPLVRSGQWTEETDFGPFSVVYSRGTRTIDKILRAAQSRQERADDTAGSLSRKDFEVVVEDSRQIRGFVKKMKEAKTESQRKAVTDSFDAWMSSKKVDPKKRQSLGKAFIESLRDAETDPWVYVVKGISDSRLRAAAILAKQDGLSQEEVAKLGVTLRREGVLTPMVVAQMARLQEEAKASE